MGKRPRRKIVLFLVEGKSDREVLRIAVSELLDQIDENIEVFFPIIRDDEVEKGGDITSQIGVHPRNIEDNIYEYFLRNFFDEEKILPKDIHEIIQIVDTDGVYISDDCIYEDHNAIDKTFYSDYGIVCQNATQIKKRNECKRENLDYLSSLTKLKVKQKSPKYSIYYFSCNLDHFIHNSANLDFQHKFVKAHDFAYKYIGDAEGFANIIINDPDSCKDMNYEESWNYIKENLNSLSRHTNIDLLFKRLMCQDSQSEEQKDVL